MRKKIISTKENLQLLFLVLACHGESWLFLI